MYLSSLRFFQTQDTKTVLILYLQQQHQFEKEKKKVMEDSQFQIIFYQSKTHQQLNDPTENQFWANSMKHKYKINTVLMSCVWKNVMEDSQFQILFLSMKNRSTTICSHRISVLGQQLTTKWNKIHGRSRQIKSPSRRKITSKVKSSKWTSNTGHYWQYNARYKTMATV